MENSLLNQAHEKERRAEILKRSGRFEEAAALHETIAKLLGEQQMQISGNLDTSAVLDPLKPPGHKSPYSSSPCSSVVIESLILQRDHHERQAVLARLQHKEMEEHKAKLEKQRLKLLAKQATKKTEIDDSIYIKQAIYKTIKEQDSLLTLISLPHNNAQAFKYPKDINTVIEELHTVNATFRRFVDSLVSQLEEKEEEVRMLKEQLEAQSANSNNDYYSGSRSMQLPTLPPLQPLPPLPPLEMLKLDFNST